MAEANKPAKNWQAIVTLALSALGVLYFLIQSLALGVFWIAGMLNPQTDSASMISLGLLVWSSLLGGILLVPILLISIFQLSNKPLPGWLDTSRPVFRKVVMWLILIWPVIVFLGWLVAGSPKTAAFLLGPINLLAAGIPVLWICNAAQWKLKAGSQVRKWRIFGFSLTVTPGIIIIVEFVSMILLGVVGVIWITFRMSMDPSLERELVYIYNQITLAGTDPEYIIVLLKPYFLNPAVLFWLAAVVGGIMPIIEEIVKPLALWSLTGRKITPPEGFAGGLLCGAGFALMENVLYATTAVIAEDWLFMAVSRCGTGVLHMLASGLAGWGLAKMWRDGKWIFLILTSLAAFFLHGLWNVLALFSGLTTLMIYGAGATLRQTLLFHIPLILLLLVSAIGMFFVHRHFIKQQSNEIVGESITSEDVENDLGNEEFE